MIECDTLGTNRSERLPLIHGTIQQPLPLLLSMLLLSVLVGCEKPSPETTQSEAFETEPSLEPAEMESAATPIGDAYLFINSQKPGVNVLASGLQFEILASGSGKSPSVDSTVKVHYQGKLVSGEVFDSSLERGEPLTFAVNQVIKGWQQALPMMKEGDRWQLVIPSELAYGKASAAGGKIPPNATLIFEIELLEVLDDG